MPSAIPAAIRHEIVRRRLEGQELSRIATELGLSYHSVRQIWRTFRQRGDDGLAPRYHRCGRRPAPDPVVARACELKRRHPRWGAAVIRIELARELGIAPGALPAARTLQLAFRAAGLGPARRPRKEPTPPSPRATRAHEVWEVDAVEKARMRAGRLASWLSVVDEATGALLELGLSPREQWQEVTPAEARELLRRAFGRWGLPERLRIDNGHPWGSAGDLPPELALWLVGLGVVPDWNPARSPWLNPKVERNNGVTQRWVEVEDCPDHATLVERLAWAGRLQREWYPALAGRSRLEAYPELTRILRPYSVESEPALWQLGRVDAFLAGRSWRRRADRYGTIWLYNRGHCLGRAHAGKEVRVSFDPGPRHWVVADAGDGSPLVRLIAHELTRERILALEVSHRRRRPGKARPHDGPSTTPAT